MKSQLVAIGSITTNPNNPRIIKDDAFDKLVQSIKDFPQMLELRPIVVNKEMVILGGNMRHKAAVAAGLTDIPVIIADNLTPEQEKEFLIKDNVSGGEWDWDVLANEWNSVDLSNWGLDVWQNPDESLENDDDDDDNERAAPRGSDDDFSVYELIMLHTNKLQLLEVLNEVKQANQFDKQEDALMEIIRQFKLKS